MVALITCHFGASKVAAQTNFRTNGTGGGSWNANATWQVESPDGSDNWVAASSTPTSASGTILIRNGDVVNVTANVTIDQTTIEAGGSVSINTNNQSLTLQNAANALVVEGTVTVSASGTASLSSPSTTALVFQNGGTYVHARNTGNIPTATWVTVTNPNSQCQVTGTLNTAGRPGGLGQNFYDFTWNTSQTGTVNLAGLLLNVANDLTISGTNNQQLQFATTTTPSGTITIGRDFTIENNSRVAFATTATNVILSVGRDFNYNSTNATGSYLKSSGSYTITVNGDFNMNATGGLLRVSGGANDGTFDLFGDFTLTDGTITETGTGGGVFNFRKTGTQVFTNTGTISNNMDYVVFGTSTLDAGTSTIDGNTGSSLTLNASARLIAGSTNSTGAIVTGINDLGNVSVATRTYASGSRVIYQSASAQFIGNGHPATAGVETEINNSSAGGVTFNTTTAGNSGSTILFIPGDLILTDGDLNIESSGSTVRSLTLDEDVTGSGGNITFSGTRSDLVINGTGAFGTFPFPSGAQSIRNFTLNRTASGSVAFGNQLTVTGTTTLTSGNVDFNATATLTGAVSISTSTIFFEGQSLTLGGNFTRTTGVLSADASSTLTLTGGTAHTSDLAFSGSGNSLNSLTLNKTNAGTSCTLNSPLTITTAFILSNGIFANTSGLNLSSGATLTRNNASGSTASMTGVVPAGGPYNLVYTGNTSFTTDLESQGSINNYSQSHTGTVTMGNDIIVAGTWTKTAGTFSCNTFTLTIGGNLTNTGTFNAGTGTVTFSNNTTLSGTTGINFFNIIVNSGATLVPESTFTIQGSFQNDGTFTQGTGEVVFSGATGGQTISGTTTTQFYDLTSNKSNAGLSITLNSPIGVSNSFTMTNGEWTTDVVNNVTMGGVNSTLSRVNTASFTAGDPAPAGTYDLVLSGAGMTTGAEGQGNINDFTCSNSGTITMGTDISITGNWTKTSGTYSCSTFTLTIGGDFTNTGTFNAATGTVAFNGNTTLSGTTTINFNNIVINSGATLTPEATLNVGSDFTNNSSSSAFVAGSGTVIFIGNSNVKNIGGTAVTTFNNLTINAGGAVPDAQLAATAVGINLTNVLTLATNATFDADGSTDDRIFTLLSSADSPVEDGRIDALNGSAAVQGNITAQRYMSLEGGPGGNNRIYRYISSPLTNATVADIQNEIPVTGTFTGTSTCSGCTSSQSMFSYDETVTTGGINGGYIDFPASNATESLVPGVGYAIFARGNVDPILTAGSALWDVRGPINSGTINYPVTFTSSGSAADDGWNLIGNPYPCTIDWNAASGWSANKATALDGSIYMRDNGLSTPQVAVWNGTVGTFGASRYIPMGQAFWVKASASATITSNENVKVTNQTPDFIRSEAPFDYIRISLEKASVKKDEAIIHFRDDATDEFDSQADAWKLYFSNGTDNLSTLTPGNLKLTINSMPSLSCGRSINLNVGEVSDGAYRLSFTDFDSFKNNITILLEDHFTGQTIDILQQLQYDFTVSIATAATYGTGRFTLKFEYGAPAPFTLAGNDACVGSDASVSIADSDPDFTYDLLSGTETLVSGIPGTGGKILITVPANKLGAGENTLQIKSNSALCTSVGLTQSVVVNGIAPPTTEITIDGLTLISNSETGNQWYKDGNIIEGATSQNFHVEESGTYKLITSNESGCTSSAEAVMTVTSLDEATSGIDQQIAVYPNPTSNFVSVSVKSNNRVYVQVVDLLGVIQQTLELTETEGTKQGRIDLRTASAGMYLIEINDGNQMYKMKILKK